MDAPQLAAWLETRLTSEAAEADYRALLEGVVTRALGQPLEAVLPRARFVDALIVHLDGARLADGARFAVREVITRAVEEGRADEAPIGRWLTEPAQARLLDFAARPGWVDRAWVDQLFQEKAMEALVSDTLYRALVDFSTIVPRIVQGIVQNVMPSSLGKLAKLGGKATGGVAGRVVDEVEKRLEAEIRKFLDRGTRRALESAAAFCVERLDSPETAAAQRHLVAFALGRSGAAHVRPLDDETLAALEGVAVAAAESVAAHDELAPLVRRVVGRFYEARGGVPLADALRAAGVDPDRLAVDAWAEATWPAVRGAFEAPEVKAFLLKISGEILSQVEGESGAPPA